MTKYPVHHGERGMRGRTILRALLLPIPLLLAGCGVVAAFVPPIAVGDALGVEGQSLTTTFGSIDGARLGTQAFSSADTTVEREFDDMELDLRGFSVAELHAGIGLDPTVVLRTSSTLAAFPSEFTITKVHATATVSDDVNGRATLTTEREIHLTFALDTSSCTADTCRYAYAGGDELEDVLSVGATRADGDTLATFVDIVRFSGAPSLNTGSFSLSVESDSEPSLDGFSATFTLRSGGTVIELGG